MISLNLPSYDIKLRRRGDQLMILDDIRRRYVDLTPEEYVRQHFVHYLTNHLGYPLELLANEVRLQIGDKKLRADSLVYNRELHPVMIIEYKAPHIAINKKVFDQISDYNFLLHVDYLTVSNGMVSYCCKMDYESRKYVFIDGVPSYQNILQSGLSQANK